MAHLINLDDFLKDNRDLKGALEGKEEQCIMMRPQKAEEFMDFIEKRNNKDFYCIIGCNQYENKKDKEEMKRWNKEQLDRFCAIIEQCDDLVLFRLNGWIFDKEQMMQIISSLCATPKNNLKVIDLGSNQLGLEDAKYILDLIEAKKTENEGLHNLNEINFVGNYINLKRWSEQLIDVHTLGCLVVI